MRTPEVPDSTSSDSEKTKALTLLEQWIVGEARTAEAVSQAAT